MTKDKLIQFLKLLVFPTIFLLWFFVVLYQHYYIAKIYNDNLTNEILNYKLLQYLVVAYQADDDYPSVSRNVLTIEDWKNNLESRKKYLIKNKLVIDELTEDELRNFKDIYQECYLTFDYTKYNYGRMIYFSQEQGEMTQLLYENFVDIGKKLSVLNDKNFKSYDDQITTMEKGIKNHSLYIIISTLLFIVSYYIIKCEFWIKRLVNMADIVMLITIALILAFTAFLFVDKSAELTNYATLFNETLELNTKKEIIGMDLYKFMLFFLKDYISEYIGFFLLLITLGEFTFARMEYKDKDSVVANLFLMLLSGFRK